jgi:CTP:molybdopterin cytidylyltransferase MocA
MFPQLVVLEGDRGAKLIIERYASERIEIDFYGGEDDIDTMDDQVKLKE